MPISAIRTRDVPAEGLHLQACEAIAEQKADCRQSDGRKHLQHAVDPGDQLGFAICIRGRDLATGQMVGQNAAPGGQEPALLCGRQGLIGLHGLRAPIGHRRARRRHMFAGNPACLLRVLAISHIMCPHDIAPTRVPDGPPDGAIPGCRCRSAWPTVAMIASASNGLVTKKVGSGLRPVNSRSG